MSKSPEEIQKDLLPQVLSQIDDKISGHLKALGAIAISGPNHLDLRFPKSYDFSKRICEKNENREQLQRIFSRILGHPVQISISFLPEESPSDTQTTDQKPRTTAAPDPETHPFVSRVIQVFGASLVSVESHTKPAAPSEEMEEVDPSD